MGTESPSPQFMLRKNLDIKKYARAYDLFHMEHNPQDLRYEKEFISIPKPINFLDLKVLRDIARWKSPRSSGHIEDNTEGYVREITGFALHAKEEQTRIEALTILSGVGWPTASVILHFFHQDPYPILDVRALNSLGVTPPNQYHFDFWWSYVEACRDLSKTFAVGMRTLDKALWEFDRERNAKEGQEPEDA